MEIKFENRRQFFEQMAEMFIASRQIDKAIQTVELLTKEFGLDGKILLLRVRLFDLFGDCANVIRDGETALAMGRDLGAKDLMMLHNVVAMSYDKIGAIERAAEHYLLSSQTKLKPFDEPALRAELMKDRREDYSNYLFALHRLPPSALTSKKLFNAVKNYDKLFSDVKRFRHKPRRRDKIRIGYVSPDLRDHVAGYFAAAFFTHHDRERFEVYGYAACKEDSFSELLKSNADGWRNIRGETALDSARKIYDDELDILVDLSGHTSNNCLPILAYKPAPLQISGIGWIDSTGLRAVDYFLVDRYTVDNERAEKLFTEKLIRLPRTHFCYRWHGGDIEIGEAPCLTNGYVTFGSFNNFSKVTDEQLKLWAAIMRSVPDARLLIKSTVFGNEYVQRVALARIEGAGINLARVMLEGGSDYAGYLRRMLAVDVMLDSFPYVGGGTTCDALYVGVPVISLCGERHGARFGLSFLTNVGVSELCASSAEGYVELAVNLAGDFERIDRYHRTLRDLILASPLMDAASYMSDVEAAYVEVLSKGNFYGR